MKAVQYAKENGATVVVDVNVSRAACSPAFTVWN